MYFEVKNKDASTVFTMIIMIILIMMIILNTQNILTGTNMIYIEHNIPNLESDISLARSIPNYDMDSITVPQYIQPFDEFIAQQIQLKEERELAEQIKLKTVESTRNIHYSEIDVYTDLSVMTTITADEMNEIINYWETERWVSTPFSGKGQVFIDAAKESGLDPVYLLAHAALESGWGNSYYGSVYHNYFGIGAYDNNPDNAINYGNDGVAAGIIEGAKWIARNYYENGQTSLYSMRYNGGSHEYCTSTTWIYNISNIITESYQVIQL